MGSTIMLLKESGEDRNKANIHELWLSRHDYLERWGGWYVTKVLAADFLGEPGNNFAFGMSRGDEPHTFPQNVKAYQNEHMQNYVAPVKFVAYTAWLEEMLEEAQRRAELAEFP